MVGVELIRGDLSITPGCTVTTVDHGKILACGHPIFSFGNVSMPLARAHVVTTLASAMASTKIITTGGTIGTLTQDRVTAIAGHLGEGPPMIPVDVTLVSGDVQKQFHFEVIESPQLTPLLVARGNLQRNRWQHGVRRRFHAATGRRDRDQRPHHGSR